MTAQERPTLSRLEAVLDEQHELYSRLDELSAQQAGLIEADQTDDLLRLLTERGGVIARLERSNDEMRDLQTAIDAPGVIPDDSREALRRRVETVQVIAARVAERDAADERALAERRDALSGKLRGNTQGRAALSAYGRGAAGHASPAGARFQDRRA